MSDVFANFDLVVRAFVLTIGLFVVSGLLSLVLGTVLAAFRVGPVAVLARAGAVYVAVVRNTPLLVVFIFVFVALPRLDLNIHSFFAKGCLALTVYTRRSSARRSARGSTPSRSARRRPPGRSG